MQKKIASHALITRLHQLAADGLGPTEIADLMGVHRVAVIEHLQFRRVLSYRTAKAIRANCPLPSSDTMTVYQAAACLPGHPFKGRLFRLIRCGALEVSMSESKRFETTLEAVRKAALLDFEPGLYFCSETVASCWPAEAARLAAGAERVNHRLYPARQKWYYRAADVSPECMVNHLIVHKASRLLDLVGVATI